MTQIWSQGKSQPKKLKWKTEMEDLKKKSRFQSACLHVSEGLLSIERPLKIYSDVNALYGEKYALCFSLCWCAVLSTV